MSGDDTAKVLRLPDGAAPFLSEEAMALDFAARHAEHLRFVNLWRAWMWWDGSRWRRDDTLWAFDKIRPIVRERARLAGQEGTKSAEGQAIKIASGKAVAGVEKLARADRRFAATADQWDREPMLLGTPAGVVDLTTGEMRDHHPQDYLTRSALVPPDAQMEAPLWENFLKFVTQGDRDLTGFLQRVAGYCLTGSTKEHALFFIHGPGGNGKSVFVNTLARVMGEYARTAAMETFIDTGRTDHPTDLAMLQGARLVTARETEEGRRWAEAKLKQMTGGDPITARFMRQDYFEYEPQFKLVVMGNHKPSLRSVDEAMRRRLHLIPFLEIVPEEERDLDLPDKLLLEAPAILAWAIEGCLAWQDGGLDPPEVVCAATADYLAEEDALGRWIEERCIRDPKIFCPSKNLFSDWKAWANTNGEPEGTQIAFSRALTQRGFETGREERKRGFRGIAVRVGPAR